MVGLNYMRNLLGFYLYKYPVRPHKRFAQLFQGSLVLVQEDFRLFSMGRGRSILLIKPPPLKVTMRTDRHCQTK